MFTSRNYKELDGLTIEQRTRAFDLAYVSMPTTKKVGLRLVKLVMLTPVFFLIAKVHSWYIIPWLLLVFFLYPLITKPIELKFVQPYLAEAVKKVKPLN